MNTDFDVIVVGSGISGGWAAKEFAEQGLKTLVIERGRMVKHIKDYPTANLDPWEFPHYGAKTQEDLKLYNRNSVHYAFNESTKHFYVADDEQPYIEEQPFRWIRGYQVGGKSLLWARQTQRWSPYEFSAPKDHNYGIEWPIDYTDLAPWYSHVEKFVGISGTQDGIDNMPDSEVVGAFEMNVVEREIASAIHKFYPDRRAIIGRCANLAELKDTQRNQGRSQCMARSLCERGCPFGGYFSSNSSTLPYAEKTGNLHIRTDSIVKSVLYDETIQKASGVVILNTVTGKEEVITARIIFLNASTLNTNLILLNSRSNRFPNGLGNDNGQLGRYIVFHNYRGLIRADMDGYDDAYYYGRRPTQVFMPAFKNIKNAEKKFKGTYLVAFSAFREGWNRSVNGDQVGPNYKDSLCEPGKWRISMQMQGEVLPVYENHVRLSNELDKYGMPKLITHVTYSDNDVRMMEDFLAEGEQMLIKSGASNIQKIDQHIAFGRQPGLEVHEMGGVRMGHSPSDSLLNKYNQLHACPNVFVTDGACMITAANQNPSLTFMAITARAANYAIDKFKEGTL